MSQQVNLVPNASLQRALTKALGTANSLGPHVEYFQELAKACPELQQSADELAIMHEHLDRLCRTGLRGQLMDDGDTTRG